MGITLNETSRDEHVGDIERYIPTVKERMRAVYNTMPFNKVPARLVIEMAKTMVFWLNAFPILGGVSRDLSPRTILTGQKVDYQRHCRYQFGEYTQTHEEHDNSMNPRTVGALALRPVGNGQGSFYFLSVSTGRVHNRLHATALPMPDDVIDKIHRMAWQQKNNPGLIFADRNLHPDEYDDDDDDNDDETYRDNDNDNPDDDDDDPYHHNGNNGDDENDDDGESFHRNDDSDDDDEEYNDDNDSHDGDKESADNNNDNASDRVVDGPPMVDTPEEDDGNEPLVEDIQSPADIVEQPDNPPGEIPGVGAVDHEGETEAEPVNVSDETELGIPGVEGDEDDSTVEEQPEAPPDVEDNVVGGYSLRNRRSRNYSHRYAGKDFVVGDDTGITLATRGDGEVLEPPQMSSKSRAANLRERWYESSGKGDASAP